MGWTDKQHADWCEEVKAHVFPSDVSGWAVVVIQDKEPTYSYHGDTRRQAIDAAMRAAGVPECEDEFEIHSEPVNHDAAARIRAITEKRRQSRCDLCGGSKQAPVVELGPQGMALREIECPAYQGGEEPRP